MSKATGRGSAIVVVIHSGLPTGAPRIGLEVASFLRERGRDVLLLSMEEGPIVEEARGRDLDVIVMGQELDYTDPEALVAIFTRTLQDLEPSLVFCNSLATSLWAIAGKRVGAVVALNAMEMRTEMLSLLSRGRLLKEVGICADAFVVAAKTIVGDFIEVVGSVPAQVFELGSFIDLADLHDRQERVGEVNWTFGREFKKWRPVVGMCGFGGIRKGFDRFVDIAEKMPDYDFLWVGDVTDGPQLQRHIETLSRLPNAFVTGWIENPIPFVSKFDVFLLTSREDPNPIAALEAYALGIPLIVFTETGETWKKLRGGCFACFGSFDEETAMKSIKMIIESDRALPQQLPDELTKEVVLGNLAAFLEGLMKGAPAV